MNASRCPLLGWSPHSILVEGRTIGSWFFDVELQPEVGERAYDQGAELLTAFFHSELNHYLDSDLLPLGRKIIDCCLAGGTLADYAALIPQETLVDED